MIPETGGSRGTLCIRERAPASRTLEPTKEVHVRGEFSKRETLRLAQARLVGAPTIGEQAALQRVILPTAEIADIVATGIALEHKEAAAWTRMHCVCAR